MTIGAYYFNGWTGKTNHLTTLLKNSYSQREPLWGWNSNTDVIMSKEIEYASNAGIDFFSFCWYYVGSDSTKYRTHPLNQAINLFINSQNSYRLKFNLLVANHAGAVIRPEDWHVVTQEWIKIFKEPNYLLTSNKPLITFFSLESLLKTFKSQMLLKQALNDFRKEAIKQGLQGVSIAVCVSGSIQQIQIAKQCGFDILTGYNYHDVGFRQNQSLAPLDSLYSNSRIVWNKIATSSLSYIPPVTLNWDARPWLSLNPNANSNRYLGYSRSSVYKAISDVKDWANSNSLKMTPEKIVVIYAWNEYGEGAWLAPTKKFGNTFLNSLKQAIDTP